jgi:parallel beta-helix repeat protein
MTEPIYITLDGTIEPEGAPISTTDNVTYTLTDDIVSRAGDYGIVIERDNIILDGQNHILQGGVKVLEFKGIYLYGINNVTIKNMNIKSFDWGIYLKESSNIVISRNNVTNNNTYAVYLKPECANNTISENNITNNGMGIILVEYCSQNSITENNIANNKVSGIGLTNCFNNSIIGNDMINNNGSGIYIRKGGSNIIHHNNFIDNKKQADVDTASSNVWDNGTYGNYWGDYTGWDGTWILGFVVGRDGIGDQPYVINTNNIDHYPVTTNWPPPDIGQVAVVIVLVVAVVGVAFFIRRKRKRKKA